jgi:hypothetical protein
LVDKNFFADDGKIRMNGLEITFDEPVSNLLGWSNCNVDIVRDRDVRFV